MSTQASGKSASIHNKSREGVGSTGALIGAAAAGIAVGLAANLGRKLVVQAPTAMAGDWMAGDWMAALVAEHQMAIKLFDALQATTIANTAKRSMLLAQLKHALARHAVQEESCDLSGVARGRGEEQGRSSQPRSWLCETASVRPRSDAEGSTQFLARLGEVRSDIEKHMREEEDELFPRLNARLCTEKNKHLTALMNKEGFKLA